MVPGSPMNLGITVKLRTLKAIRHCLPKGKTPFHYFKDGYACSLLAQAAGEGARVSDLKKSDFAQLLDKPAVKQALARFGGNTISREDMQNHWQEPCEPFFAGTFNVGWAKVLAL